MAKPVRRVVTGHDASGKAVVLMDGPAPNQKLRGTGLVSTLMWATDETPADISGADDRAARDSGVAPPSGGSILRVVDFPPLTTEAAARLDQTSIHREMGLGAQGHGAGARHPFTHRTRSIDYAFVLDGEIDMLLDDTEVHLRAGDILVQQGTNHAWVNNSKATCRIAFVLIDAQAPDAWKAR
ncbi:MAG TPA: cupin domain-containing protein [Xanthobacteraceae bacterium]|nr:cupin domain-containing protein [Xanthobacteraceae bacterium]